MYTTLSKSFYLGYGGANFYQAFGSLKHVR